MCKKNGITFSHNELWVSFPRKNVVSNSIHSRNSLRDILEILYNRAHVDRAFEQGEENEALYFISIKFCQ